MSIKLKVCELALSLSLFPGLAPPPPPHLWFSIFVYLRVCSAVDSISRVMMMMMIMMAMTMHSDFELARPVLLYFASLFAVRREIVRFVGRLSLGPLYIAHPLRHSLCHSPFAASPFTHSARLWFLWCTRITVKPTLERH